MSIIMDSDGRVRPFQVSDLKEVAERDRRIAQLERLNASLAAQCDRLGKVVDAVLPWEYTLRLTPAADAIREYREHLIALEKGEGG
jgi:hypothetical protein